MTIGYYLTPSNRLARAIQGSRHEAEAEAEAEAGSDGDDDGIWYVRLPSKYICSDYSNHYPDERSKMSRAKDRARLCKMIST